MTYSEKIDIETRGWVYHPALVTYKLSALPQWEQTSQMSEEGEKRKKRNFLEGYSAEFTFLQYKPYTLRIFAKRQRSTLNSNFAERSKTESDHYGATLMLKYNVLPTILSYNHEESTQTGFHITDNDTDEFHLSMQYNKNLGDTRLIASYKDSTQTTDGIPISVLQQKARLQNYYDLTKDKRVTLDSSLIYEDTQSDFTESTRYELYENLSWRHRRNLTTKYTFRYNIMNFEAGSRESRALRFNLNHLLYENFTTLFNADGLSNHFPGGRELAYGAGLNFGYNREIPWGMLNINIGHNYNINNRDITADSIQVIDEFIILTTGIITLLANEHVDIDSIVVTDNTGTIVYIRDIDYRITETDSFARISRIPGGGIADGQEVLVDYKHLSNPAFDYSTFGQSYGISLSFWSAWKIFYMYNHSKQSFLSGIPPDELIDDSIHTAGTELDLKWSRTKFEFKDRQTTNVPTTSWRAEETVTLRPFKGVFSSLYGSYGTTKFKDTGEIEKFNTIRATIQVRTSRRSKLRVEGFRNKISGAAERITDTGVSSTFEWVYRIWSGSLRYRFLNEEDEIFQETRNNHYILFEIKRALF